MTREPTISTAGVKTKMAQKEPALSGTRKRLAACSVPMMSLIRQPKRSRTVTVGQILTQMSDAIGVLAPPTLVAHVQPVTPSEHHGAQDQPRKVLRTVLPKQNAQTPSHATLQPSHRDQMSSLGSVQKEPAQSGSEAEDSSDDELPEIKLTLPDVSEKEKYEAEAPEESLGDQFHTFGSLAKEIKSEHKVEPGSNISQVLQPVIQKLDDRERQIASLQKELEEKKKEISQFKETEKEMRQRYLQQDTTLKELESHLQTTAKQHEQRLLEKQKQAAQLREAAKQHEQRLLEKQKEVAQLREAYANQLQQKDIEIAQTKVAVMFTLQEQSKQQTQQLQQKDQQIAQLLASSNRGAQSVQNKLQVKTRKISQLEVAAKQHEAKVQEKEQELSAAKESLNISEQKRKQAEEQLKAHREKLQQLESTCTKDHQLQLQQKDQEIAKHVAATKQQAIAFQEREQEVLHLKEQLKKLPEREKEVFHLKEKLKKLTESDHGELTQLNRLSKQQTTKIQELQKMLQDREKEVAQSRESVKRKLQEQERKIKDWLTAIPIHGLRVVDLPSYSS